MTDKLSPSEEAITALHYGIESAEKLLLAFRKCDELTTFTPRQARLLAKLATATQDLLEDLTDEFE
jgi:hypothetical protein